MIEIKTRIAVEFASLQRPEGLLVADGSGDESGRDEINDFFGTLPWQSIPEVRLSERFEGSQLSHHLTPTGFCYYLPAMLTNLLAYRDFGWFERLLVPCELGLEDVADYFGDGNLFPYESLTVERQQARLRLAWRSCSAGQLDCVAEYIDIAESCQAPPLSVGGRTLLEKFIATWRNPPQRSNV